MESQTAATASPHKDTLLMLIAAALFAGGLYSFYYFDPQLATTLRVLILLGSFGLAAAVGYRTETGRSVWSALTGARTELRKVIWPTRQESVQTTIMIAVVVAIMALLLWGLDSFLLYGVSKLTGRS